MRCRLTHSPSYTLELNGRAERSNRTIWEMAYVMLLDCNVPFDFWPYAVIHATLLSNMLLTKGNVNGKSSVEMKFGITHNLSNMHIFGCTEYVHIAERELLL